jgi:hypothetical protein
MKARHDATGQWHEVELDRYGRVPPGYRAQTEGDAWASRVAGLREEAERMRAQGRHVEAEQAERTLAEMGA